MDESGESQTEHSMEYHSCDIKLGGSCIAFLHLNQHCAVQARPASWHGNLSLLSLGPTARRELVQARQVVLDGTTRPSHASVQSTTRACSVLRRQRPRAGDLLVTAATTDQDAGRRWRRERRRGKLAAEQESEAAAG